MGYTVEEPPKQWKTCSLKWIRRAIPILNQLLERNEIGRAISLTYTTMHNCYPDLPKTGLDTWKELEKVKPPTPNMVVKPKRQVQPLLLDEEELRFPTLQQTREMK